MKYLFNNKEVKIGDICIGLCLRDHLNTLKISQYFKDINNNWNGVGRVGIKIVWTSKTRCKGYLVHQADKYKHIIPYKINKKLVFITFTTGNNVGLLKYNKI